MIEEPLVATVCENLKKYYKFEIDDETYLKNLISNQKNFIIRVYILQAQNLSASDNSV